MVSPTCLHQLFEQWARTAPDRVAVTCGTHQLTYRELDERANGVAAELVAHGVGPDVLVGLCADRSADLVVGLLGILKAGGAYVPLDPEYPAARLGYLVADSAPAVVVTVSRVAHVVPDHGTPVVVLDDVPPLATPPPAPPVTAANLAYVIYTSGSTGEPKGVLVEHGNVVRLFTRTEPLFGFGSDDVWSFCHSISFDFSVWEIWGALLYGGRVVVVPGDVARMPDRFLGLLEDEGVTMLSQTPSAFRHLVDADARAGDGRLPALRTVVFGGERLDVTLLPPWIARHGDERPALVNMYGITETTVHVTYRRITRDDVTNAGVSPIGRPIDDLGVHLLDVERQPVPDGTPGEMYVSGPGVARGYLGRPGLTAERFVHDVAGVPGPVYRSGDLGVRLASGELAYLGRADDQIKVRGFRVEPAEIEACLRADARVKDAVVVARDYGESDIRLVAYVLPADGEDTVQDPQGLATGLAAQTARSLPAYMRPSSYVMVPDIPLTVNGKVDREALATSARESVTLDLTGAAEPAGTRRIVRDICAEVLERADVPTAADLFDIGATSLAFVRVLSRINEQFGLTLSGAEFSDVVSVDALAAYVDATATERLVIGD